MDEIAMDLEHMKNFYDGFNILLIDQILNMSIGQKGKVLSLLKFGDKKRDRNQISRA